MKSIKFRLTAYTDPAGKWNDDAPKRGNEDDLFVDANLGNGVQGEFVADQPEQLSDYGCLMVVADGMGGTNAGEVASAIAIETVKRYFRCENLTPSLCATVASRTKYMEQVVVAADKAIKEEAARNEECEGMGSTIVMLWLKDNVATVTWCGDSRAYIFRDSVGLKQISKDHSYVQGLVDEGKITEEIAFSHPYNNIITRSLGDPDKRAVPESRSVEVYKGDILMLCSDGLCGVLRDRKSYDSEGNLYPGDNLEDLIRANRSSMVECRKILWAAAEQAEWYDNVTAILCEILDGETESAAVNNTLDVTSGGAKKMQGSVISINIKKSNVKLFLKIVLLISLCIGGFFAYKNFKAEKAVEQVSPRDSLIRVAEGLNCLSVLAELTEIPDTVKLEALRAFDSLLTRRMEVVQRIDTMMHDARYSEVVDRLESLRLDAGDGDIESITAELDEMEKRAKEVVEETPTVVNEKPRLERVNIENRKPETPVEMVEEDVAGDEPKGDNLTPVQSGSDLKSRLETIEKGKPEGEKVTPDKPEEDKPIAVEEPTSETPEEESLTPVVGADGGGDEVATDAGEEA